MKWKAAHLKRKTYHNSVRMPWSHKYHVKEYTWFFTRFFVFVISVYYSQAVKDRQVRVLMSNYELLGLYGFLFTFIKLLYITHISKFHVLFL